MPINLLVLILGLTFWTMLAPGPNPEAIFHGRSTTNAVIGEKRYELEIADDLTERGRGLSWRKTLAKNRGMLFIFEKPGRYIFTMEGMLLPLDFIWLKQGKVVDLKEAVNPTAPDRPSTNIEAKNDFDQVIELNAGEINAARVKLGDRVAYF
ncbi:hypothetical protein A3K48_05095 [candidate division WOR-1 bacterium RIFOXYA12_FULL_52_29]|uniref:DUF192 domain-containing protein n=1 Tax=candidate division WOR-1 bacterium RIFOXYC12_FULL_54_18 TaxID=1802584 RepID=A0A1F4T737_UNCSA|nr:MAG: hypothetical protein A3K44_05095 [candidate division WOR-1 bacterium RIFOXYA2_FULL_51_19]OGC17922.1 MAG: hypothetical protein A3K48_05095 [candidate division WOR-1 bacterium RIFOXYA12_FULL_52_29]OGC26778.1 MAG: hypothetical protein A3K32_05090 [candidate division WOR-1 bacterium RIFOXYB2_FULL_45_9]OGC28339.1 MAG: hypothetical protein A3K49_05095 [candidate division WOR-1 bacterium RIFOXYC12_FULL_54_18]OGC31205.1 MAG: hypothetical protein A2346_07525 [candidate division WOR-1 bacterium R